MITILGRRCAAGGRLIFYLTEPSVLSGKAGCCRKAKCCPAKVVSLSGLHTSTAQLTCLVVGPEHLPQITTLNPGPGDGLSYSISLA